MTPARSRIQAFIKTFLFPIVFLISSVCTLAQTVSIDRPHLIKSGSYTQLFVNNKPFIITGGELGNSSASNIELVDSTWPNRFSNKF